MRKFLIISLMFLTGSVYAGILAEPFSDKITGGSLTAAEVNTFKNTYRTVINGNLDASNLATNAVDSDELTADSVIPSKVDEDNNNPFVMRALTITNGVTASTMTTTSTGTFAIANIASFENSPTFTYGFTATTITVTSTATIETITINTVANSPTFIYGINIATIVTNGFDLFIGTNVAIPAGAKFRLDGISGHTYFQEISNDSVQLVVGGGSAMGITASRINNNFSIVAAAGIRVGGDSAQKLIDDSSNPTGSTTLYIGDETITTSSDIRLKKNIKDTKVNALNLISLFRVVDFDWNDKIDVGDARKKGGSPIGMVAQEIQMITPWAINAQGGENCDNCLTGVECEIHPNPWIVRYNMLVPLLIKSIQELKNRITVLENR